MHLPFQIDIRFRILDIRKKIKTKHLTSKVYNLKSAFTLIELLVVISIIGILLSVAIVSYNNAQQKGRDNKRKTDLKAVQQALELYYQQNGKYPDIGTSNAIKCNTISPSDTSNHAWGTSFTCSSKVYMNPLPSEPITGSLTPYWYWSDNATTPPNQTYKLFARLENTNDKDLNTTPTGTTGCNAGTTPSGTWQTGGAYFCVINP